MLRGGRAEDPDRRIAAEVQGPPAAVRCADMRAVVVCALMSMLAIRAAIAESRKPVPVLESHPSGQRPSAITATITALQDELETRGFAARPASVLLLAGDAAARPGVSDPELTSTLIVDHMNSAWSLFVNAKWKEAAEQIPDILAELDENPGLVVTDTSHLDMKFRLMIALFMALDNLQNHSAAVSAAATNAIRVFPARAPGRTEAWGKRGETVHADYAKQVQTQGRGRMIIAGGNSLAQIFIEGQLRGVGNVSLSDMIPGLYQVFILVPNGMSRRFRARVSANDTSYLTVRPEIDSCLWLSTRWTGLASCSQEGKVATQLAQEWTGRDQVVILRSGEENGRPTITGLLYRGGEEKRSARIFADESDRDGAEKLALFLVDGKELPGLAVTRNDTHAAPVAPSRRAERSPWWPKVVLGAGMVTMAGATGLYLAWPDDDHTQPTYDDKKSLAVELYSGGAVVSGVGLYGWLRSRRMRRVPAAMFGAGTTAVLLAAMLIPTDQDTFAQPPGFWQREYYRDTATAGAILLGVGAGLVAGGYVLRGSDPAPLVSASRGGLTFGWAGSF